MTIQAPLTNSYIPTHHEGVQTHFVIKRHKQEKFHREACQKI